MNEAAAVARYRAARLVVAREMCEADFSFFVRYFFKARKGAKFIFAEHHQIIANDLMDVWHGRVTNLIINCPPRYGKTELVVVLFVAWCIVKNPRCEFIHLSYADTLALDNSAAIREVIRSKEFQELWPHITLMAHKDAKGAWATAQGGAFLATSTGGQVTGFGAGRTDEAQVGGFVFSGCFPADEAVMTERGPMMIGDIVEHQLPIRVHSYNELTHKIELQQIDKFWRNPPNSIVTVTLSDGASFRCTPDHKIYTSCGWIEARNLTEEHLLPEHFTECLQLADANPDGCGDGGARHARRKNDLWWRAVECPGEFPSRIGEMSCDARPSEPQFDLADHTLADAKAICEDRCSLIAGEDFDRLLSRELSAGAPFEQRECPVPDGVAHVLGFAAPGEVAEHVVSVVSVEVPTLFPADPGARKCLKHKMVHITESDAAIFGEGNAEISMAVGLRLEDAPLERVSRPAGWNDFPVEASDKPSVAHLVRANVPRYRRPISVIHTGHADVTYCLEVRGNHNFYLDKSKVLVSNCVLVDDPLKPDDARHDTLREGANRRWTETIQSRRNSPKTPTICVMQRIHKRDFTQALLDDGRFVAPEGDPTRFRHRILPALIDEGLPTERALWPAKHSVADLKAMRDQRNDRGEASPLAGETFAGQYQQTPTPAGGGIIKNAWWRRYSDRAQVEALCTFFMITADTAYTSSTANDPSAIQLWGCQGKKRMYLLDEAHGWWEFPELVKQISAFWARNPKAKRLYIENKASGPSLGQTLRKSVPASSGKVVLWKPKDYLYPEDKVGRMKEWARQVHAGLVWVPSDDPEDASYQPWVIPFVEEHDAFTADDTHAHDDRCDAATMANSVWVSMGGGIQRPQYNAGQEPQT